MTMRIQRLFLPLVAFFASLAVCVAEPAASWGGLVGLFTQPTAETLQPGHIALTYSEIRFNQENDTTELRDSWFQGCLTTTLTPHWEIGVTSRHEILKYFVDNTITAAEKYDQTMIIGDIKYIFTPPKGNRVGVAAGIMDITDDTNNIDGIDDLERGRRFFTVGSYKWAHLGLTYDDGGFGAYGGADLPITNSLSLIVEIVSQPTFVGITPEPDNTINFNLGARFYPPSIPGLRVDAAAVGDGTFNYGFSFSYEFKAYSL
jgi:hypothetical protein